MKNSRNENEPSVIGVGESGTEPDLRQRNWSGGEQEQLLRREQEARLEAEVMRDANLALTQDLSLERILETLLDYLRRLVPFDSANVMLVEGDSYFVTSAIRGYEGFLEDLSLAKGNIFNPKTNALFGQISETKQSLLVPDTNKEPRWQSVPGSEHIRNWIGVPLIAHNEIIGLYSLDKAQPGYFTAEHVKIAESLAVPAASAIQNAKLFRQVERHSSELEQRVAERKEAEDELRKQKEILQKIFDHIPVMINFTSAEGRVEMVNEEWERTLGWSLDEIHKQGVDVFAECYPDPAYREEVANFIATADRKWADFKTKTRDGRTIDTTWARVKLSGGASIGIGKDISARKLAEEALRKAEQRYRDILDNVEEGIFQTSPEGRFILVNRGLARMLGFDSPEELIAERNDIEHQHYVYPERRREFKKLLSQTDMVSGFELEAYRKDGSKIWLSENVRAVRGDQGDVLYYLGTAQDINERKRAEARSAAFATLARKLSGARTPLDAGRIIARTAADLFGWDSCDLNHYDADRDLVYQMLNIDIIEGRQTEVFGVVSGRKPTARGRRIIDHGPELRLRDEPVQFDADAVPYGDRTRPSASIMTVPIRHANRIIGLFSIQSYTPHSYDTAALNDLQALADHCGGALNRIRAEQSLTESEERFRQMAENFEDVIWITDRDMSKVLYINPAYEKVFGRSCESVYERLASFLDAVHPDDREMVERMLGRLVNGNHLPFEYRIVRPDETVRWLQRRSFPIKNNEGEIYRVAGIVVDITERKHAEEALRQSEVYFRSLIEHAADTISTFDANGVRLYTSPSIERVLGYNPEEMIGLSGFELLHPDDRPLLASLFTQAVQIAGTTVTKELRCRHKDGTWRTLESTGSNLLGNPAVGAVVLNSRDITERRRAEAALRESEERYRKLAENFPNGAVITYDTDLRVTFIGGKGLEEGGFSADFFIGKSLGEIAPPEVVAIAEPHFRAAFAGRTESYECPYPDGRVYFAAVAPLVNGRGLIDEILVISQDITEHKRAQEELRESEERYRDLVENSRELICTHDLDGLVLSANRAAAEALGYDLNDFVGKRNVRDILAPEVRHQFDEYMARVGRDGETSGLMLVQTSSGERRLWEFYNSLRTEGVSTPIVRGMARDITERKRAEESLQLFRNLIDQSNDAIEVIDPITFRFIDCNQSAHQSLGYTREEFLALTVFDIDPLADPSVMARLDEEMKESGSATLKSLHRRKDGTTFPVEVNVKLVKLEADYRLAVVRDISGRERAEAALRLSEERYRELFENARDAIYVHDLGGRYTSVNRAAEKLSGYTRKEILGKHFSNFVSPRDLKEVRTNLCRKLDNENETVYEVDVATRTGQRVPVEISSRLIYENGVVIGVQGTARDITERKRAQEALRIYSQRLIQAQEAEREKIARELHDQIGQILTAVKINLQSIQRSYGSTENIPRFDDSIAIIDEALGRVRELSIELRPSLLDDLGLTAALRWYVDHFTQRTGIIAEVHNGSKEEGRLPGELETACFRIAQEALTNVARHAKASSVSVQLEQTRERILLTVTDDGIGFDLDNLRQNMLAASALGLRGMEERALAAGGYIKIDSGSGRGTSVRATFPLGRK